MDSTSLIALARFDRAEQLAVARSILDNANIASVVRNEYTATILPLGDDFAAELMVREEDAVRASRLLRDFIKGI